MTHIDPLRPDGATAPAAPGFYPGPPQRLSSVRGLGTAIQILLVAFFLAAAGVFVGALRERALLDRLIADRSSVSLTEARDLDQLNAALSLVTGLLYLATGIVWIVWIYRARLNVEAWNPYSGLSRPGWSIGIWFIPLVALVGGAMIVKGIVEVTDEQPDRAPRDRRNRAVVVAWAIGWAALGVSALVMRIKAATLDRFDATIGNVTSYSDVRIVCTALIALAAVPAFALVRTLTRGQTERILGH